MTEPTTTTTATPISLSDVARAVTLALGGLNYDPANYDVDAIAADLYATHGDRTLEAFHVTPEEFATVAALYTR